VTTGQSRYSVTVKRELIARHYLVGGDWGRENELNSHRYGVEARYEGATLDGHGFLVDIEVVETLLDEIVERYRERTLNELPEFAGLNPSVEHFARILAERLAVAASNVDALEVTVSEDGSAAASYRRSLSNGD
jgi:6-pyruvoyltetrahydropterin/6-carboxytetrahydropterin synthase